MAIDIAKPQPIRLGNRYLYTLSSYEPVEVTITVERVTDADVDFALESVAEELHTTIGAIDDAWVREHFQGLATLGELRERLRQEREHQALAMAERAKSAECAQALAKRLGQQVPDEEVAGYRAMLLRTNELDAGRLGLSLDDLLSRMGTTRIAFEATLTEQAAQVAAQEAAFSAFASERKLKVDDSEIPVLLAMDPADAERVIDSARSSGGLENLRRQCLSAKAALVVSAEATCIYERETEEAAQKRAAAMRESLDAALAQMRKTAEGAAKDGGEGGAGTAGDAEKGDAEKGDSEGKGPGLHLV